MDGQKEENSSLNSDQNTTVQPESDKASEQVSLETPVPKPDDHTDELTNKQPPKKSSKSRESIPRELLGLCIDMDWCKEKKEIKKAMKSTEVSNENSDDEDEEGKKREDKKNDMDKTKDLKETAKHTTKSDELSLDNDEKSQVLDSDKEKEDVNQTKKKKYTKAKDVDNKTEDKKDTVKSKTKVKKDLSKSEKKQVNKKDSKDSKDNKDKEKEKIQKDMSKLKETKEKENKSKEKSEKSKGKDQSDTTSSEHKEKDKKLMDSDSSELEVKEKQKKKKESKESDKNEVLDEKKQDNKKQKSSKDKETKESEKKDSSRDKGSKGDDKTKDLKAKDVDNKMLKKESSTEPSKSEKTSKTSKVSKTVESDKEEKEDSSDSEDENEVGESSLFKNYFFDNDLMLKPKSAVSFYRIKSSKEESLTDLIGRRLGTVGTSLDVYKGIFMLNNVTDYGMVTYSSVTEGNKNALSKYINVDKSQALNDPKESGLKYDFDPDEGPVSCLVFEDIALYVNEKNVDLCVVVKNIATENYEFDSRRNRNSITNNIGTFKVSRISCHTPIKKNQYMNSRNKNMMKRKREREKEKQRKKLEKEKGKLKETKEKEKESKAKDADNKAEDKKDKSDKSRAKVKKDLSKSEKKQVNKKDNKDNKEKDKDNSKEGKESNEKQEKNKRERRSKHGFGEYWYLRFRILDGVVNADLRRVKHPSKFKVYDESLILKDKNKISVLRNIIASVLNFQKHRESQKGSEPLKELVFELCVNNKDQDPNFNECSCLCCKLTIQLLTVNSMYTPLMSQIKTKVRSTEKYLSYKTVNILNQTYVGSTLVNKLSKEERGTPRMSFSKSLSLDKDKEKDKDKDSESAGVEDVMDEELEELTLDSVHRITRRMVKELHSVENSPRSAKDHLEDESQQVNEKRPFSKITPSDTEKDKEESPRKEKTKDNDKEKEDKKDKTKELKDKEDKKTKKDKPEKIKGKDQQKDKEKEREKELNKDKEKEMEKVDKGSKADNKDKEKNKEDKKKQVLDEKKQVNNKKQKSSKDRGSKSDTRVQAGLDHREQTSKKRLRTSNEALSEEAPVAKAERTYPGPGRAVQIGDCNAGFFYVGCIVKYARSDRETASRTRGYTYGVVKFWDPKFKALFVHKLIDEITKTTSDIQIYRNFLAYDGYPYEDSVQWITTQTMTIVTVGEKPVFDRSKVSFTKTPSNQNLVEESSKTYPLCRICNQKILFIRTDFSKLPEMWNKDEFDDQLTFTDFVLEFLSTYDYTNFLFRNPVHTTILSLRELEQLKLNNVIKLLERNLDITTMFFRGYDRSAVNIYSKFMLFSCVKLIWWIRKYSGIRDRLYKKSPLKLVYWGFKCTTCSNHYHAKCLQYQHLRKPQPSMDKEVLVNRLNVHKAICKNYKTIAQLRTSYYSNENLFWTTDYKLDLDPKEEIYPEKYFHFPVKLSDQSEYVEEANMDLETMLNKYYPNRTYNDNDRDRNVCVKLLLESMEELPPESENSNFYMFYPLLDCTKESNIWRCPDCKICMYCSLPIEPNAHLNRFNYGYGFSGSSMKSYKQFPPCFEEKVDNLQRNCSQSDSLTSIACVSCNATAHRKCCNPVVPSLLFIESWKCDSCTQCISCGYRDPIYVEYLNWGLFFFFCLKCWELLERTNYCGICYKVWTNFDTNSQKWVQCEGCRLWIHVECDDLARLITECPSSRNQNYRCYVCRSPDKILRCMKLLEQIFLADKLNQFRYPVSPSFVTYWRLVTKPMNLVMLFTKLEGGRYESYTEFIFDTFLIPYNAKMVNMPNTKIYRFAIIFERKLRQLVTSIMQINGPEIDAIVYAGVSGGDFLAKERLLLGGSRFRDLEREIGEQLRMDIDGSDYEYLEGDGELLYMDYNSKDPRFRNLDLERYGEDLFGPEGPKLSSQRSLESYKSEIIKFNFTFDFIISKILNIDIKLCRYLPEKVARMADIAITKANQRYYRYFKSMQKLKPMNYRLVGKMYDTFVPCGLNYAVSSVVSISTLPFMFPPTYDNKEDFLQLVRSKNMVMMNKNQPRNPYFESLLHKDKGIPSVDAYQFYLDNPSQLDSFSNVLFTNGFLQFDDVCIVCGSNSFQSYLIYCEECAEPMHYYCAGFMFPPKFMNYKRFKCAGCTKCQRCEMNVCSNHPYDLSNINNFHFGDALGFIPTLITNIVLYSAQVIAESSLEQQVPRQDVGMGVGMNMGMDVGFGGSYINPNEPVKVETKKAPKYATFLDGRFRVDNNGLINSTSDKEFTNQSRFPLNTVKCIGCGNAAHLSCIKVINPPTNPFSKYSKFSKNVNSKKSEGLFGDKTVDWNLDEKASKLYTSGTEVDGIPLSEEMNKMDLDQDGTSSKELSGENGDRENKAKEKDREKEMEDGLDEEFRENVKAFRRDPHKYFKKLLLARSDLLKREETDGKLNGSGTNSSVIKLCFNYLSGNDSGDLSFETNHFLKGDVQVDSGSKDPSDTTSSEHKDKQSKPKDKDSEVKDNRDLLNHYGHQNVNTNQRSNQNMVVNQSRNEVSRMVTRRSVNRSQNQNTNTNTNTNPSQTQTDPKGNENDNQNLMGDHNQMLDLNNGKVDMKYVLLLAKKLSLCDDLIKMIQFHMTSNPNNKVRMANGTPSTYKFMLNNDAHLNNEQPPGNNKEHFLEDEDQDVPYLNRAFVNREHRRQANKVNNEEVEVVEESESVDEDNAELPSREDVVEERHESKYETRSVTREINELFDRNKIKERERERDKGSRSDSKVQAGLDHRDQLRERNVNNKLNQETEGKQDRYNLEKYTSSVCFGQIFKELANNRSQGFWSNENDKQDDKENDNNKKDNKDKEKSKEDKKKAYDKSCFVPNQYLNWEFDGSGLFTCSQECLQNYYKLKDFNYSHELLFSNSLAMQFDVLQETYNLLPIEPKEIAVGFHLRSIRNGLLAQEAYEATRAKMAKEKKDKENVERRDRAKEKTKDSKEKVKEKDRDKGEKKARKDKSEKSKGKDQSDTTGSEHKDKDDKINGSKEKVKEEVEEIIETEEVLVSNHCALCGKSLKRSVEMRTSQRIISSTEKTELLLPNSVTNWIMCGHCAFYRKYMKMVSRKIRQSIDEMNGIETTDTTVPDYSDSFLSEPENYRNSALCTMSSKHFTNLLSVARKWLLTSENLVNYLIALVSTLVPRGMSNANLKGVVYNFLKKVGSSLVYPYVYNAMISSPLSPVVFTNWKKTLLNYHLMDFDLFNAQPRSKQEPVENKYNPRPNKEWYHGYFNRIPKEREMHMNMSYYVMIKRYTDIVSHSSRLYWTYRDLLSYKIFFKNLGFTRKYDKSSPYYIYNKKSIALLSTRLQKLFYHIINGDIYCDRWSQKLKHRFPYLRKHMAHLVLNGDVNWYKDAETNPNSPWLVHYSRVDGGTTSPSYILGKISYEAEAILMILSEFVKCSSAQNRGSKAKEDVSIETILDDIESENQTDVQNLEVQEESLQKQEQNQNSNQNLTQNVNQNLSQTQPQTDPLTKVEQQLQTNQNERQLRSRREKEIEMNIRREAAQHNRSKRDNHEDKEKDNNTSKDNKDKDQEKNNEKEQDVANSEHMEKTKDLKEKVKEEKKDKKEKNKEQSASNYMTYTKAVSELRKIARMRMRNQRSPFKEAVSLFDSRVDMKSVFSFDMNQLYKSLRLVRQKISSQSKISELLSFLSENIGSSLLVDIVSARAITGDIAFGDRYTINEAVTEFTANPDNLIKPALSIHLTTSNNQKDNKVSSKNEHPLRFMEDNEYCLMDGCCLCGIAKNTLLRGSLIPWRNGYVHSECLLWSVSDVYLPRTYNFNYDSFYTLFLRTASLFLTDTTHSHSRSTSVDQYGPDTSFPGKKSDEVDSVDVQGTQGLKASQLNQVQKQEQPQTDPLTKVEQQLQANQNERQNKFENTREQKYSLGKAFEYGVEEYEDRDELFDENGLEIEGMRGRNKINDLENELFGHKTYPRVKPKYGFSQIVDKLNGREEVEVVEESECVDEDNSESADVEDVMDVEKADENYLIVKQKSQVKVEDNDTEVVDTASSEQKDKEKEDDDNHMEVEGKDESEVKEKDTKDQDDESKDKDKELEVDENNTENELQNENVKENENDSDNRDQEDKEDNGSEKEPTENKDKELEVDENNNNKLEDSVDKNEDFDEVKEDKEEEVDMENKEQKDNTNEDENNNQQNEKERVKEENEDKNNEMENENKEDEKEVEENDMDVDSNETEYNEGEKTESGTGENFVNKEEATTEGGDESSRGSTVKTHKRPRTHYPVPKLEPEEANINLMYLPVLPPVQIPDSAIDKVYRMSLSTKCCWCNSLGASVKCAGYNCDVSFHLSCAFESSSKLVHLLYERDVKDQGYSEKVFPVKMFYTRRKIWCANCFERIEKNLKNYHIKRLRTRKGTDLRTFFSLEGISSNAVKIVSRQTLQSVRIIPRQVDYNRMDNFLSMNACTYGHIKSSYTQTMYNNPLEPNLSEFISNLLKPDSRPESSQKINSEYDFVNKFYLYGTDKDLSSPFSNRIPGLCYPNNVTHNVFRVGSVTVLNLGEALLQDKRGSYYPVGFTTVRKFWNTNYLNLHPEKVSEKKDKDKEQYDTTGTNDLKDDRTNDLKEHKENNENKDKENYDKSENEESEVKEKETQSNKDKLNELQNENVKENENKDSGKEELNVDNTENKDKEELDETSDEMNKMDLDQDENNEMENEDKEKEEEYEKEREMEEIWGKQSDNVLKEDPHKYFANTKRSYYLCCIRCKDGMPYFTIDLMSPPTSILPNKRLSQGTDFYQVYETFKTNLGLDSFDMNAETFFGLNLQIVLQQMRYEMGYTMMKRATQFCKISAFKKSVFGSRFNNYDLSMRLGEPKVNLPYRFNRIMTLSNITTALDFKEQGQKDMDLTDNRLNRSRQRKQFDMSNTSTQYRYLLSFPAERRLDVKPSVIHGLGLFANEFIPAGEPVVEYVGELIRDVIGDQREELYSDNQGGDGSCYMFRLDEQLIVDATNKGNMSRFINHSCDPNCLCRIITCENGLKHIVVFAKIDLNPGDEVTYDYQFGVESETRKLACLCGAPNCLGRMN